MMVSQSERTEAARIHAFLAGDSIDDSPLWFASLCPTYAGAIRLSQMFGIKRIRAEVYQGSNAFHAVCFCEHAGEVRIGAGSSKDSEVAVEFAFRSAVKQFVPGLLER